MEYCQNIGKESFSAQLWKIYEQKEHLADKASMKKVMEFECLTSPSDDMSQLTIVSTFEILIDINEAAACLSFD